AMREGVAPDAAAAGARPRPGLAEALARVRRLASSPGLVVVVSDFRDGGGWPRALRALSVRHELIAVELTDPREGALPDAGDLVVAAPGTGELVEAPSSDPALRAAFASAERARREELAAALRRAGAQHVSLGTDQDWLRELARRIR